MRLLVLICCVFLAVATRAQKRDTTFFDLKVIMDKMYTDFMTKSSDSVYFKTFEKDTVVEGKSYTFNRLANEFYVKRWSTARLTKGKDYPDVYFETMTGEAKALSDYKGDLTFLIYNYAFCQSCLNMTDTLLTFIKPLVQDRPVNVLTLLSDHKVDGEGFYEKYYPRVQLGFITKEQEIDYTLNMGTPFLFILDRNRRVVGLGSLMDIKRYTNLKSLILGALEKN